MANNKFSISLCLPVYWNHTKQDGTATTYYGLVLYSSGALKLDTISVFLYAVFLLLQMRVKNSFL